MVCVSSLKFWFQSYFSFDQECFQEQGTCLWESPSAQSGDRPSARSGHSLTVIGRSAFLFGGSGERDSKPVLMNEVYALDLQSLFILFKIRIWTKLMLSIFLLLVQALTYAGGNWSLTERFHHQDIIILRPHLSRAKF